MLRQLFRNIPFALALAAIVVTLFIFVSQLVAINAARDRSSDSISRIERECARLTEKIKGLQATKERLCNAEVLRVNPCLPADLKEVPAENVRRVRTMSIPYGSGRRAAPQQPKALAVELSEMAALSRN